MTTLHDRVKKQLETAAKLTSLDAILERRIENLESALMAVKLWSKIAFKICNVSKTAKVIVPVANRDDDLVEFTIKGVNPEDAIRFYTKQFKAVFKPAKNSEVFVASNVTSGKITFTIVIIGKNVVIENVVYVD